jgi:hypothetical protein
VARLAMSPEQSAWITARVASFPAEAPEQLLWEARNVADFGALPLYLGWSETIGIRADGEIVRWSTEGDYPGARPVLDRYTWVTALVDGTRRYEALRALLPSRPADAVDCRCLVYPVFCEGKILCPECCGLGWVRAADT